MSGSPRSLARMATAAGIALAGSATLAVAQSTAISPFVSYVPSAAANPFAGMALTFGGTTGLAFRGSADISISNPARTGDSTAASGVRPWSTDADGVLFLGGLGGGATVFRRSVAPYVFSGIGLTGGDSAGRNMVRHGWSYGVGATLPLGLDASLFGEARWRMSQYVLPTAKDAPDSKSELRFGLSFFVGGSDQDRRVPRRRYSRYDDDDDYADAERRSPPPTVVAAPAPVIVTAPPPTVVTVPQTVVIASPPEPRDVTTINVNLGSVIWRSSRSSRAKRKHKRHDHVVVVTPAVPIESNRRAPTESRRRPRD